MLIASCRKFVGA